MTTQQCDCTGTRGLEGDKPITKCMCGHPKHDNRPCPYVVMLNE